MPKSSYSALDFFKNRIKTYINEKKSKKISIKGILKKLFLKPPFIGEFVFIILLLTAWLWTLITTPSLIDLGTMSISLLTDDQIKEYKNNMVKNIVSDLESRGMSLSNMKLTEKLIGDFATVSFLKTSGEEDKPGKNLVYLNDKSGKINFSRNDTDTFYYLDNFGNTKQVKYSSVYIQDTRTTNRWKGVQSELEKKHKNKTIIEEKDLNDSDCFEIVLDEEGKDTVEEYLQIAISNILDPFLVKSNVLLYLYTSTNNSNLCENFIKNKNLDSEIILERHDCVVTSSGSPQAVKITEDLIIEFKNYRYADDLSFVRVNLGDGTFVAKNGTIKEIVLDDEGEPLLDKDGNNVLGDTIATYNNKSGKTLIECLSCPLR